MEGVFAVYKLIYQTSYFMADHKVKSLYDEEKNTKF